MISLLIITTITVVIIIPPIKKLVSLNTRDES